MSFIRVPATVFSAVMLVAPAAGAVVPPVIDTSTPTVVPEAKDEASNNVLAVRVTIDGKPALNRLDGTAVPVSPGEHRATFEAAGYRTAEARFVAREGQKRLRVVVFLVAAGIPAAAGAPGAGSPVATDAMSLAVAPAVPAPGTGQASLFAGRRQKVALALACVGGGAAAVGTIFAIMSKVKYDNALSSNCGGDPNRCSSQGIAEGRAAHRQATVATVGFVAAGALLAAGAVLYFTGSGSSGLALSPTGGGEGLAVMGMGRW